MKTFKFILMIASGLVLLTSTCLFAQTEEKRTFGLTVSVQQDDLGIMVPIWIGKKFTIAPAVAFLADDSRGTDFLIGLIPKLYFNTNKLAPYISARLAAAIFSPKNLKLDSSMDFLAGLAFGGEYFFDTHFSLGVEAQLNITASDEFSNRFGNPGGTTANTATAILASVYF